MAAFLVGMGEDSYFSISGSSADVVAAGGDGSMWAEGSFPWYDEFSRPLGKPLGPPSSPRWGVYHRRFEHVDVAVDVSGPVADWTANLTWDSQPLTPEWEVQWGLRRSLAAMPCNESGWSDAEFFSGLGLVTYDMNNAQSIWEKAAPSNPEEVLLEQCERTKAFSKDVKCGVYRNSAHSWSNYAAIRGYGVSCLISAVIIDPLAVQSHRLIN